MGMEPLVVTFPIIPWPLEPIADLSSLPFYRAYARIGSAHLRLGDYDSAIKSFNKSLTEHRTPDVLAKLKEAEKEKSEKERLAYLDPVKADEAREEGNKLFKVRLGALVSPRAVELTFSAASVSLPSPLRSSASPLASLSPPPLFLVFFVNPRPATLPPRSSTTASRSSATPPTLVATPTEQRLSRSCWRSPRR
jgi:hypothetical protein